MVFKTQRRANSIKSIGGVANSGVCRKDAFTRHFLFIPWHFKVKVNAYTMIIFFYRISIVFNRCWYSLMFDLN